jgi:hypothetical protein
MKTYPRYHLSALTQRGATTYHTKHKKSFLFRLNGLRELKTLKSFSFSVEYYEGGFNKSITYNKNQNDEALRVAKILTAKSEIDFLTKH